MQLLDCEMKEVSISLDLSKRIYIYFFHLDKLSIFSCIRDDSISDALIWNLILFCKYAQHGHHTPVSHPKTKATSHIHTRNICYIRDIFKTFSVTKLQLKQYKNTFVFIIMQLISHDKETGTVSRKYAQNANSTAASETPPHTIAAD